jgi:class 3 adenylate cyclase
MEVHNVERRLAAILAADVVGYSRLMEVDEAGTLARLKTIRLEVIDPAIGKCRGRIIKTTGDGMLVEFQSGTEALQCAVDFQERMARRVGRLAARSGGMTRSTGATSPIATRRWPPDMVLRCRVGRSSAVSTSLRLARLRG